MGLNDIVKLLAAILVSLGGGSLIILGFSSWLGKLWANRLMAKESAKHAQELEELRNKLTQDTESYKIKLKKSEFIFQREYEAASEFVALIRSLLPAFRHPDMDWYDACDDIACGFDKIERILGEYLSKHGAVLGSEVSELLGDAISIAGRFKFETNGLEVPTRSNKAANSLYEKLQNAEKLLLKQVHEQSTIK